jgi:predicted Zn finger-like uncharacterized protein
MKFACPGCGARYEIEGPERLAESAGQVQCYRCNQVFVVPDAPPPAPVADQPETPAPETPDAGETSVPVRRPTKKPRLRIHKEDRHSPRPLPHWPDCSHLLSGEPPAPVNTSPRHSPLATLLWTLGIMALMVALAGQALWHFRADPRARSIAGSVCAQIGCELPPLRQPKAFRLTERVFTRIPDAPDILVMRLRLANTAAFAQPYPGVELVLYDGLQAVVGKTRVVAADYLPAGTPDHLEPGELGEVELNVLDPGQAATGFEVDFF